VNKCWATTLILLTSVLNVVDGLMTLGWVLLTDATEFNPFMKPLIESNPVVFIIFKTVAVTCCLSVLWAHRQHWLSKIGMIMISVAYTAVVIYHTWAMVHFIL
jgi:hypothetical protein